MTTEEADIRLRILLAAKKLFARQGFDGTTVRQICDEAAANVALVSYYFGGKENLFAELMKAYSPGDRLAKVPDDLDPITGVAMLIREVTIFRYQEPELIRIVQHEIVLNSPRIQHISIHMQGVWRLLRKLLERGREQGVFSFTSLDSTFMSVVGTLIMPRHTEYWTMLYDEPMKDLEKDVATITEFIMNGLQCAK